MQITVTNRGRANDIRNNIVEKIYKTNKNICIIAYRHNYVKYIKHVSIRMKKKQHTNLYSSKVRMYRTQGICKK